ncbi:lysozyme inhibitor LprI family protein [Bacillus cereus group sp. BfR-BA-01310]|uniref:lysozyme inhibitor LprI family protein n=1 Tax=Bacillus cereus group sp. BfR-BA-01310 TaxID=2920287 RepID=UPI001F59239A|nr:lysozyme inhibitor LprI family protein [Bacillus cereus group sp. BfR-BA-01310]
MKKLSKLMSFCLAISMLVVTGCEKSNNYVQLNEKVDQLDEAPEVTEKEAKKIVRKSVDEIANSFSEMEKENGWSRNNPGDLDIAKKGVKGLVSNKFVENQLPGLLDTFNRSRETDMLPFPIHIEPEVRLTYSQKNDVLKIETLTLANDMGNEAETWEFILVYKDGKWLMDRWSSNTPADLKLTKEEANELLRVQGFKNVSFVREENSGDKKYIFKESNGVVAVDAQTSVITYNVDDKKQEKITKEDVIQEQETAKRNDSSTYISSKKEKQLKKESSSALGKTKVLNELAALENQEKHTNVMTTNDIVNEIEGNYQLWDSKLNEIYNTLKNTMSPDAFQSLKTKQIAWVKEKESKVKAIGTDPNNGTMRRIEASEEKYKMTKERCYELVNGYMN